MIVDVSAGKENFSQRNNKIKPSGSCATTSITMALDYAGIVFPKTSFAQPEDSLINFILTDPQVEKYYKINFTSLYNGGTPANEVHAVNVFGTNLFLGSSVLAFTTDASVQDILFRTVAGRAVPVSGVWSKLNHVVCVVGFNTSQDDVFLCGKPSEIVLGQVKSVIIDDPYGNYQTGYKDPHGNNVEVPFSDFVSNVKSQGKLTGKWAYWVTLRR